MLKTIFKKVQKHAIFNNKLLCNINRYMHPIKPKSLSLGLVFQFFDYVGFGFGYFANFLQILELNNLKYKKKIFLLLGIDLSINKRFYKKNQN